MTCTFQLNPALLLFIILYFVSYKTSIGQTDNVVNSYNYERRLLNTYDGINFKNILHLDIDKDSGIWMISNGKLLSYKNGQATLHSETQGVNPKPFHRAKSFLRTPKGDLYSQNESFIIKIHPDARLTYYAEIKPYRELVHFAERQTMINYLSMVYPYYHHKLEKRSERLMIPEYNVYGDSIVGGYNGKYNFIGRHVGKFKSELSFGDINYFITEKTIYKLSNYKKIEEGKIMALEDNTAIPAQNILNVFFRNNRYYLVTTKGLYKVEYQNGTLKAKLIIAEKQFVPQTLNCMLVGPNEDWFLFGAPEGLVEFTKTGMSILKTNNQTINSTNSILYKNGLLHTQNLISWDHNENLVNSPKNPLVAYGDDYIEIDNKKIVFSFAKLTRLLDSNLNPIKDFPRESYYNGLIKDERNNVFEVNQYGIRKWIGDTFIRQSYIIPNTNAIDIVYSCLKHKDTFYIPTYTGVLRFKEDEPKSLPTLLPDQAIRNFQAGFSNEGVYTFTDGGGIYLINGEKVIKVPSDKNNYLRNAHYFYKDLKDRVWIPTNYGLLVAGYYDILKGIADSTHQIQYFYFKGPGTEKFTEFNGSSKNAYYFNPTTKTVYFCSMEGIVKFKPDEFELNFPIQRPNITYTQIKNVKIPGFYVPQESFESLILQLEFTTIGPTQNYVLEYRIGESDNPWLPVNELNQIILYRNKTGEQTLELRYRTGIHPNEYRYVTWKYYIRPYLYERPIFYLALLIIATLGLIAYNKWRTRKHLKRQKELERIINQKTQEISKNLEDLKISEEQLRAINLMKEKLINVLAHDIRSPLISTYYISEHIYEYLNKKLPKQEDEEIRNMMKQVSVTVMSVYSYANDFLIWYKFNQGNVKTKYSLLNIHETLKPIVNLYAPIIQIAGNKLEVNVNEEEYMKSDPKVLSIILRNLVDNANKYTQNGTISIKLIQEEEYAVLQFQNPAVELTDSLKKFMQERLLQDYSDEETKEGEMLGLRMIGFFCSILSIKINLKFIEPNIVCFELMIPYAHSR